MTEIKSKKIPTVILDIDDTIVDFIGFLLYLYNSKNNTSVTAVDITTWDFITTKVEDAQGNVVKGAALRKFFKDYEDHGLYAATPVIKESQLALELMRRLGYKIILLTARPEKYKKATEISLIVNKVPYDEIVFDIDKSKQVNRLARKHSIHLFADDNVKHVLSVFETDKVEVCYLINRPHNKGEQLPEGVNRINDLLEAVRNLSGVRSEL